MEIFSVCRFRRAWSAQGRSLEELPYRTKWFPFGPLLAMKLCAIVIAGQFIGGVSGGKVDWAFIIASYFGLPLFLAIWLGHKWKHKTKFRKLEECDLSPV
ncbi:hypothetical protein [Paenibacillus caui]|uniref:hypothetical protein n=1 Tax=Paenibacillus caui TaxID=2873927 RepID=UPI001CA7C103|nr:hypothetical protein [Paenibacillus caui]